MIATSSKIPPAWGTIIYMGIIHAIALFAVFPSNFNWQALGVALVLYVLTAGVGITLGFHRLVSHRSYQVPKLLEYFLVFCGTLAGQGGPIDWVGLHRIHHQYSDLESDPHNSLKGFYWSHLGWMLCQNPANEHIPRYTKDISSDRFYQFCQYGHDSHPAYSRTTALYLGRFTVRCLGSFCASCSGVSLYLVC